MIALPEATKQRARQFRQRPTWLKHRQQGIGGSDAAAVLNIPGAYRSRWEVWADKLGISRDTPGDASREEMFEIKLAMEGPVCHMLGRVGRDVQQRSLQIFADPAQPFVMCTPDAFQLDLENESRGVGIVQCKAWSEFDRAAWEDKPPLHYEVQLQHEMAATGLEWGTLAVIFGSNEFAYWDYDRNDGFITELLAEEANFWQGNVQANVAPPVDDTMGCARALAALYPEDSGRVHLLSNDFYGLDRQLTALKEQRKLLDAGIREAENMIRAEMGDATFGRLPGGEVFTLRTVNKAEFTVQATSYRQLNRRKKPMRGKP